MHQNDRSFDDWAKTFYEHYERGSREEAEFRYTRKLVITARKWAHVVDEQIKAKTGYNRSRWQTLSALSFSGEPVATLELAHRMGVQWPTLVRVLNAMEAEGLVHRTQDRDDRRYRLVEIAEPGRALLKDVHAILDPVRSEMLRGLSTDELIIGEKMLDQLLGMLTR